MDEYRLPPQLKEPGPETRLFNLTEHQLDNSPIAAALKAIGGGLNDLGNAVAAEFGNGILEGVKAIGKGLWEGIKAAAEGVKEAFVGKDKEAPKPEPQKESLGQALAETIKAAIGGAKEGIEQANQKTKEPVNTRDLKDRLIAQHREGERQKTAREAQKVEQDAKANPQPRQASMRPAESSRYERTR